jgi:hypothetical protein
MLPARAEPRRLGNEGRKPKKTRCGRLAQAASPLGGVDTTRSEDGGILRLAHLAPIAIGSRGLALCDAPELSAHQKRHQSETSGADESGDREGIDVHDVSSVDLSLVGSIHKNITKY